MARLILGHTTDTSIKVWVRASERWPVAFVDVVDCDNNATGPTKVLDAQPMEFYTGVLEWKKLNPDTPYTVKVAFGKTRGAAADERVRDAYTEGRFRTFPAVELTGSFSFVLGSCNLHSLGMLERPDRAWVEISRVAKNNDARFMIHCGDQIYSDIPRQPSIDVQFFRDKYLDAWEDCVPARRTLTELSHYMILDDHELINNFDTATGSSTQALANAAIKAYWEFQHSHNPASRHAEHHYHYEFNYGAVKFFVMDTRYYRSTAQRRLLDEVQEDDLLRWLSRYRDDLKFVVTSVPFVGVVKNSEGDKWSDPAFEEQRSRILEHVLETNVSRLTFLTGDMHTSYHATLEVSRGEKSTVINELMSSPINQYTPNIRPEQIYNMNHSHTLPNGISTLSCIDPDSFYGNHSNVMVIDVDMTSARQTVGYKIFRTTKAGAGPSGKFHP
ncbi:alkaline phosphatase D family protein [Pseudomonas lini]